MRDKIILFDVDQTLLYSGGAGSLAMRRAFHQLYGIDDGFRGIGNETRMHPHTPRPPARPQRPPGVRGDHRYRNAVMPGEIIGRPWPALGL